MKEEHCFLNFQSYPAGSVFCYFKQTMLLVKGRLPTEPGLDNEDFIVYVNLFEDFFSGLRPDKRWVGNLQLATFKDMKNMFYSFSHLATALLRIKLRSLIMFV